MKEYFCFSLLPDQNVVFARNGCDFSKKAYRLVKMPEQ